MKTIILYGELAERYGKTHRFAVKTAAEAIRALRANFRGFEQYMMTAHTHGTGFKIFVGGHSLTYDDVPSPIGKTEVIRIVPVIVGAANGWTRILIGAALIVAGVFIPGAQSLIFAGAGLVLGGIAQLLTKPPSVKSGREDDRVESYVFSGPTNVSSQGAPIPVVYGRMMVGSAVVSAGIDVHED